MLGEPPFTIGWDISGTVTAIGQDVDGVAVGDEVFGMPFFPRQAAPMQKKPSRPPASWRRSRRRSTMSTPAAAHRTHRLAGAGARGRAGRSSAVLIHGAGGGVGHLAVQIAKARGAIVIATASADKSEFDHRKDFGKVAQHVDAAVESIGSDHTLQTVKSCSTSARPRASRPRRVASVSSVFGAARQGWPGGTCQADRDRQTQVHVAKTFPLDQAASAHVFQASQPVGKVVLTV